jgi:hypothetical protein
MGTLGVWTGTEWEYVTGAPGPQGERGEGMTPERQAAIDAMMGREFDIRRFGAVADNDAIDNIPAINGAISSAVAAGGGTVIVPAGTWYVKPSPSSWIIGRTGIHLHLLPGAVLKVRNDTGAFPVLISDATKGDGATYVEHFTVRGGTIDLSPATNTGYTMDVSTPDSRQQAIKFGAFRNISVEGVTFHSCGRNTVVLSGPSCYDVTLRDNTFHWEMGPVTTVDEYDNSAVYITVRWGATVTGNHGYTDPAEHPRGFVELHGQGLTFTNNHSDGFGYLCYITPHSSIAQEYGTNAITVTGNTARRAWKAVSIFSFAGKVLTGVTVADNVLGIAQQEHNWNSAYGIAFEENASTTGDYEDVTITGNTITFEPNDLRTTAWTGAVVNHALTYGIGVAPYGNVKNVVIADNIVKHAPSFGIKIGRYGEATKAISHVTVSGNQVIDAGDNNTAANAERAGVALFGTLVNVTVRDTRIIDTGTPSRTGYYPILATGAGLVSATDVYVLDTDVWAATGTMPDGLDRTKVATLGQRVTLDPPSIPAGASISQTVTIKGAKTVWQAHASPAGGVETGIVVAWVAVTAQDTVTIRLTNISSAAVDPVSRAWNIVVIPIT